MKKHKKILIGIIGSLVTLLLLAVGFLFFLPRLIDMEPVKERILVRLSQGLGGQVTFEKLDLSCFRRPRAVIHQGILSVPTSLFLPEILDS
jgi:hypothetical protein